MKFTPGQVVRISNLRKASFYLYKSYLNYSPLLICPCIVKRHELMTVIENFDNNVVLLKIKNSNSLTMTYAEDLESVFEK